MLIEDDDPCIPRVEDEEVSSWALCDGDRLTELPLPPRLDRIVVLRDVETQTRVLDGSPEDLGPNLVGPHVSRREFDGVGPVGVVPDPDESERDWSLFGTGDVDLDGVPAVFLDVVVVVPRLEEKLCFDPTGEEGGWGEAEGAEGREGR